MPHRNVTIALPPETAQWLRIEAAKHDLSLSRYLAKLIERERQADDHYAAAMADYLNRLTPVLELPDRLPDRDSLYDRAE